MAGIVAYGAYIPKYRLSRSLIAQAWGSRAAKGEKAVANFDEDTITMATEAALDCLGGIDTKMVDAVYFASTTAPYREKQCASLIATVLDCRRDILASDFSGSMRAGSNALKAALDAVISKSAKLVLVTVSDCRLGTAQSNFEQDLGDGAAAFLIGDDNVIAKVTGDFAVADEFTDLWRMEEDKFIKYWDERFNTIYGYMNSVTGAVKGLLEKYKLKKEYFNKAAVYAHTGRQYNDIAKKLGFDIKTQFPPSLYDSVGNTGTATALLTLAYVLEQAQTGDRVLLVDYGEGAQAFVLEVTDAIKNLSARRGVSKHLASKTMLPTYEKYVQFRNLIVAEEPRVYPTPSSVPLFWRDRKSIFSFYGSKCNQCSLIQHPVQRVCFRCQSKDDFTEVKLARRGKIFTYSEDYLADVPVLPQISASIDLDDGARVFLRLTETEPQNPVDGPQKIDMPVEMTFRKMHDISGFRNYYWKARPPRGGI